MSRDGRAGRPARVPRFAFLGGDPPAAVRRTASGRLELARWITRPDHPLTARVIVNRIWQHHFGRGIVPTPSNFGVRGEPPSHPELLDWLAARFVASGWSIKDLHRQILRRGPTSSPATTTIERGGRPRQRLALAVQPPPARRRVDPRRHARGLGPARSPPARGHPFPPIEQWGWTQHNAFKAVYPTDHRAVYLMTQRLVKHPFLALFDGPDTNTSTDVRSRSTVPLQALFLMNNPFVQEQAAALAGRLIGESADRKQRLDRAWELAWGRHAVRPRGRAGDRYLDRYAAELAATRARRGRSRARGLDEPGPGPPDRQRVPLRGLSEFF